MDLKIGKIGLPGAAFHSAKSLVDHGPVAEQYESAVRDYEETGDKPDLWESLRALGFENDEIQWHVAHRGQRMARGYV